MITNCPDANGKYEDCIDCRCQHRMPEKDELEGLGCRGVFFGLALSGLIIVIALAVYGFIQ